MWEDPSVFGEQQCVCSSGKRLVVSLTGNGAKIKTADITVITISLAFSLLFRVKQIFVLPRKMAPRHS